MKTNKKFFLAISLIAVCLFVPGAIFAGDLEPSGPPSSTMKTLEVPPSWHQILPATERFQLVMNNEAVLDKETGLVWARNTAAYETPLFSEALEYCNSLENGGRKGWRLPTIKELLTLIDPSSGSILRLPNDHPFISFAAAYWSSTRAEEEVDTGIETCYTPPYNCQEVYLMRSNGSVSFRGPTAGNAVWAVRGSE